MRKIKQRSIQRSARNAVKKTPVNSKLPDDIIQLWHLFAVEQRLNKEEALAEIIKRGTK